MIHISWENLFWSIRVQLKTVRKSMLGGTLPRRACLGRVWLGSQKEKVWARATMVLVSPVACPDITIMSGSVNPLWKSKRKWQWWYERKREVHQRLLKRKERQLIWQGQGQVQGVATVIPSRPNLIWLFGITTIFATNLTMHGWKYCSFV